MTVPECGFGRCGLVTECQVCGRGPGKSADWMGKALNFQERARKAEARVAELIHALEALRNEKD